MQFNFKAVNRFLAFSLVSCFSLSVFAESETPELTPEISSLETKFLQRQDNIYQIRQSALNLLRNHYQTIKPNLEKLTAEGLQEVKFSDLFENTKPSIQQRVNKLNQKIADLKGISTADLLQVEFANEAMLSAWANNEPVLFTTEPKGAEKDWNFVVAYDESGNNLSLSTEETPLQPVLVVSIDNRLAFSEGIQTMQRYFADRRQQKALEAGINLNIEKSATTLSTTVLNSIRLDDDEESWLSGRAEVYALVTGIDPFLTEPVITPIDMPYLDHDDTTYFPNQILFFWDTYRFNAADILLMEDDDGTNYQEIAVSLLGIAESALNQFGQPTIAAIVSITNAVISALPSRLFVNDDDYLDVYYTIRENITYSNHRGASRNAQVSMSPLLLSE